IDAPLFPLDNDIVQEVASKGLVLVYNLSALDPVAQKKLVDDLVKTMGEGKGGFKITGQSELFPKGMIPVKGKSGEGSGSVSSYKEISSIAEEVGQPDLV